MLTGMSTRVIISHRRRVRPLRKTELYGRSSTPIGQRCACATQTGILDIAATLRNAEPANARRVASAIAPYSDRLFFKGE
jgi:hypothetical protein